MQLSERMPLYPATALKKGKKKKRLKKKRHYLQVRDLVEVYLTRFIEDYQALGAQGQVIFVAGKKKMIQGKRKYVKKTARVSSTNV
jgi:hypothetical protein